MPNVFEPRLRAASIVPRWSIVWRTRDNNIAEHSWYVTVYSMLVAQVIEWKGPAASLLAMASLHEIEELVTGDVVSPVKTRLIDRDRLDQFVDTQLRRSLPFAHSLDTSIRESVGKDMVEQICAIIKVADTLDALFFLLTEELLGNRMVADRVIDSEMMLVRAWAKLPCSKDRLHDLYNRHIVPAIAEHRKGSNHDIGNYDIPASIEGTNIGLSVEAETSPAREQAVGRPGRGNAKVRRKGKVGTLPGAGLGENQPLPG